MSSSEANIQFGYCLPIFANPGGSLFRTPGLGRLDARQTLELGIRAEEQGFDSLWVADHLMLGRDEAILEGWTTLSVLAGATKRARLGLIHQGHFMRPGAVTAKMIATLDNLSKGRFIAFYDFGRQEREHLAFGLPYPQAVEDRVQQTLDGLAAMRALWTADSPVTGTFGDVVLQGAVSRPRPLQQPHPPIWFGETEPGLLRACAEYGSGWNSAPVSVEALRERIELLQTACAQAGRAIADIEISLEIQVLLGSPDEVAATVDRMVAMADPASVGPEILEMARGGPAPQWLRDQTLIGDSDDIAAQIDAYRALGVRHFLLWFLDAPETSGMERFAAEVLLRYRKSIR